MAPLTLALTLTLTLKQTCLTFSTLEKALARAAGQPNLRLANIVGFCADVMQGALIHSRRL